MSQSDNPERKTLIQQITFSIGSWFLLLAFCFFDAFAFQNGAIATLSQSWLRLNRYCWPLTYLAIIIFAGLTQHVSISQPIDTKPSLIPPLSVILQWLYWTPAVWVGFYIAYLRFYQAPNMD